MNNPTERPPDSVKRKGYQQRWKSDKPKLPPKEQLNILSQFYLNSITGKYNEYELEAKFGTRGIKPITKIDYDNVVKKLKSLGYEANSDSGRYTLKIQLEFLDSSGQLRNSADIDRFRVEITGLDSIQEYCKTNSLSEVNKKSPHNVKILRKLGVKPTIESDEFIESADFNDFNFRVTLKNEETISKNGKLGQDIFEKWNSSKKIFRYINRVSFKEAITISHSWGEVKNILPYQFDLSIVRSSNKNEKGWLIKSYDIAESNVFDNPETYEIEVEVLAQANKLYKTAPELSNGLQKMVKHVLCGLQKTNFPVSYVEQRETLKDYHRLLFESDYNKRGEKYMPKERLYPNDFIGPSLVTLGVQNIGPLNPDIITPNITEPYSYCVTEKADGDRHLLYVNGVGKIYLINNSMSVMFTGAKTNEEKCFNSLLDGELILHNKKNQFINIFAAFDIYYVNNVDIRARPFVPVMTKDDKYFKDGCRLPILKDFIKMLDALSIMTTVKATGKSSMLDMFEKYKQENKSPIKIVSKQFYPTFDTYNKDIPDAFVKYNIFDSNNYLLRRIADNLFEYEIDGLIFTPTLLGVGSNKILEAGPKRKITWHQCFKWKPSDATQTFPKSYNTIDFLVVTKKGTDGLDIVTPVFENGINNHTSTQYNQYKTLVLAVGFDPSKHGYINPCQDLLDEKFSNPKDMDNDVGYKPKQFFPSNPYDPLAGLCNIMLELDKNGTYQMFTEERQVFDNETVVEFRYDLTKEGLWKWIPMRVRYDKTAEFRSNNSVGANDYNTANNNWNSIHNPVTEKMIATGKDVPGIEVSDDVYYNSVTTVKQTQSMRDFHNLFVKKTLIQGVSKRGDILIDFACGKGGDFPKWISSELSFVFGIDISPDNIENRLNGTCVRYLNFKKTTKIMPYALFVNGNSALNIRNGTNMFNDKANKITTSVFGASVVDKSLGPAVTRQHGKANNGFDVSSCQFALHYMFKNKLTFYNFIRNIAECTKINGYFIATCYDGQSIFNMLKKKDQGESKDIYIDDKKVWSVTKQYDSTTFVDDDSCLGYKIDVYQDSINQAITEYLVNYDFFTSTMEKYGFTLVTREEARQMKIPEGSGMFSELYNSMMVELKKFPNKVSLYKDAIYMKDYEKEISFLNRFFVYKKTSTRNAEKLTNAILNNLPGELEIEQAGTMMARESVANAIAIVNPKAKKLDSTLTLTDINIDVPEEITASSKTKQRVTKKNNIINPILSLEGESTGIPKKKTTRKKKTVEFVYDDDV